PPPAVERGRSGILIICGPIAGKGPPQDEPHDVLGTPPVEAILQVRVDDVVGRRKNRLQGPGALRVVADGAKGSDVGHATNLLPGLGLEVSRFGGGKMIRAGVAHVIRASPPHLLQPRRGERAHLQNKTVRDQPQSKTPTVVRRERGGSTARGSGGCGYDGDEPRAAPRPA